jgi:Icc-related predicted phosphoesterase
MVELTNNIKLIKITFFSDTHSMHGMLDLGKYTPFIGSDIVAFAGDLMTSGYNKNEILNFVEWFKNMPVAHKVMIAGNHDRLFEKMDLNEIEAIFKDTGIHYLNDSGIEIMNINFWGSPIQPWFHNWAFNRMAGDDIEKHWKIIPEDVDVLITHGPAYGILDQVVSGYDRGKHVGCPQLLKHIQERIKPKFHVCGHIHEGYGIETVGETTYINASVLNEDYKLVNDPIYVYYE